jgi:hypothetical protein
MAPPALPGLPPNSQPSADVKFFVSFPIDLVTLEQGAGPSSVFAGSYVDASRTLTGPPRMPPGALNRPNDVHAGPGVEVVDRRVERSPDFLSMGKKAAPVYVNAFTLSLARPAGYVETITSQTAKTPLFTIAEDGKVVVLVSGSAGLGLPPGADAPRVVHKVKISVIGDRGTQVPVYDSTGSAIATAERQAHEGAIATFERTAEVPSKAGERYDLVIEFESRCNFENAPGNLVFRDSLRLECDEVLLFRSQGVGFES